ncbi:MmgE/PrpD family protein [Paenibacillus periandrae]|uniref:MmgE/PrpD family protein n=1 Tax=Paenibacillus periandrae TaxID=1761741 RepID=UPI001F09E67B|nr:MmgE/PrpD family protein [Paenibacillus periandrae]
MSNRSLSEIIADFTLNFTLDAVPKEVQDYAKLMIIDSMGVAIASHHLEDTEIVRKVVTGFSGKLESTLWGTQQKVSMADAVLANGAMIHGLDYDDTHVAGVVHPSASVVSTALSVGEAVGADGKDMLSAIICGWEIIIRLALAAKGKFHDHGFHATGIVAPFASACVAAKLLKLPHNALVNALGICGSQAAALQQFLHDGSSVKKLHPGWASHSAIYALMMAKEGIRGPHKIFEGNYGLYASHLGTIEGVMEAFDDLGQTWRTTEISVKLYPCCHFIHSFIDCVKYLQEEHGFAVDEIQRIECRTEKRFAKVVCQPEEAKKRPVSDYAMRFSLPYIVSMAILKGNVSPMQIDMKYLDDEKVKQLIDKFDCITDETTHNVGHFPGWVKIMLKNGAEYLKIQKYERGAAENPISEYDVITKFRNNVSVHLDQERTERLMDKLKRFDQLANITELLNDLLIEHKTDMEENVCQ